MKKTLLFVAALFMAIAANAEFKTATVRTSFYGLDSETGEWGYSDNYGSAEISYDENGVIVIPNFLGSDLTITAKCYSNGSVDYDLPSGFIDGSFDFGEWGTFESIYIYGYEDMFYQPVERTGTRVFSVCIYSSNNHDTLVENWHNVMYLMPDDFVPADFYSDKYIFELPVTIDGTRTENFSAYIKDKKLHIVRLFGAESDVIYTLSDDGTISNNTEGTWGRYARDYYEDGVEIKSLYFSGDSNIAIDKNTKVVSDVVYFYETNKNHTYSFVWPYYNVLIEMIAYADLSVLDDYVTLYQDAIVVGSKVVIPNFLGSDFQAEFDCNINNYVSHNINGEIEGNFYLADYYGNHKKLFVSDNDAFENGVILTDVTNAKLIYIESLVDGQRFVFYVNPPSILEPKDDYKDFEINAKVHVNIYSADSKDDAEHTADDLLESLDVDAKAIDSSTIVFNEFLNAHNLAYTIDDEGNVATSWNKHWNLICADINGEHNDWIVNEEDPYLVFDADNATISHIVYLDNSETYVCIESQLPDTYKRSSVANVVADNDGPVEYYNLQGVRVLNPTTGIYIRRQGSKSTTVLLR